jgi:hypothetical protein
MATTPLVSQSTQTLPSKKVEDTKPQPRLCEKIKAQLNAAVLRGGKVTAEELNDLEKHVQKVAALLS